MLSLQSLHGYWGLQQAQPPWEIGCGPRLVLAFNNGHRETLLAGRRGEGILPASPAA